MKDDHRDGKRGGTKAEWPRIICIVGLDGSGKSTISREFVKRATSYGFQYRYAWVHNQPLFLALLRFARRIIFPPRKGMFEDYRAYRQEKKSLAKRRFIRTIYLAAHSLDYAVWVLLRVRLPLWLGQRLVLDRYVYDVAINRGLLMDMTSDEIYLLIKHYLKKYPRPSIVFCIDIPVDIAFSRKNDIPSKEYLEERRDLYQKCAAQFGFFMLDGTKPVSSIIDEMIEIVHREFKSTQLAVHA